MNGGELSRFGPYVQYSLDDGETWIDPSKAVGSPDVSTNYGGNYVVNIAQNAVERTIPLIGAGGHENVRVRFGFDGDFYYWIIDDIKLIEGASSSDARLQSNSIGRGTICPMSILSLIHI